MLVVTTGTFRSKIHELAFLVQSEKGRSWLRDFETIGRLLDETTLCRQVLALVVLSATGASFLAQTRYMFVDPLTLLIRESSEAFDSAREMCDSRLRLMEFCYI